MKSCAVVATWMVFSCCFVTSLELREESQLYAAVTCLLEKHAFCDEKVLIYFLLFSQDCHIRMPFIPCPDHSRRHGASQHHPPSASRSSYREWGTKSNVSSGTLPRWTRSWCPTPPVAARWSDPEKRSEKRTKTTPAGTLSGFWMHLELEWSPPLAGSC